MWNWQRQSSWNIYLETTHTLTIEAKTNTPKRDKWNHTTYLLRARGKKIHQKKKCDKKKFVEQQKVENRIKWITAVVVAVAMVCLLKWRIVSVCTKWQHCICFPHTHWALDTTISRCVVFVLFAFCCHFCYVHMDVTFILLIPYFHWLMKKKLRQIRKTLKQSQPQ